MVTPFHLLLGNAPVPTLLSIPPGVSPLQQEPAPQTPPSSAPIAPGPSPQSKQWYKSPNWVEPLSSLKTTSKVISEEPPHSKQKEEMFLHKVLSRSHQKAFSRDSKLVQKAREEYYQENHPCFNNETSCDMADISWSMIESAGLLSSEIYEIKEIWTGQSELQYTNYALRTLPKGLQFFCPVSPLESPKVMGLTGIHHPNAFCHFNGVTHCLWCGKEGQNEGTVINHLHMTYYKLGLVCKNASAVPR